MSANHPPLKEATSSRYEVGQVWTFDSRPADHGATMTIVKIESQENIGNIIHIYVKGAGIRPSKDAEPKNQDITHMPFSEAAIDSSAIKLIGKVDKLPDFKEGYDEWREGFTTGDAGVFSVTVGKAVEYTEKTMLEGKTVE